MQLYFIFFHINLLISYTYGEVARCFIGKFGNANSTILDNLPPGTIHLCSLIFKKDEKNNTCRLTWFTSYEYISQAKYGSIKTCYYMDRVLNCLCNSENCNRKADSFEAPLQVLANSTVAEEAWLSSCILKNLISSFINSTTMSATLPTTTTMQGIKMEPSPTSEPVAPTSPVDDSPIRQTRTEETNPDAQTTTSSEANPRIADTTSASTRETTGLAESQPKTTQTTETTTDQPSTSTPTERTTTITDIPTSATNSILAVCPPSPSPCSAERGSIWSGWFIGSVAVNVLQFVVILTMAIIMITKSSGGKKDKVPTKKSPAQERVKAPTSIMIDNPVPRNEQPMAPAVIHAKTDQKEAAAETNTMDTGLDEMETTGSSTISDSTTGEYGFNQVKCTVSGFNKN